MSADVLTAALRELLADALRHPEVREDHGQIILYRLCRPCFGLPDCAEQVEAVVIGGAERPAMVEAPSARPSDLAPHALAGRGGLLLPWARRKRFCRELECA